MNQRDPEYDRFGPWVVEIGDGGSMGWVYLVAATVLGAWFFVESTLLLRDRTRAMRVFHISTYQLALWSAAIVADVFIA